MSSNQMGEVGDRISNLPKEIIHEILAKLPLCESARTSILSSCWRYNWITNPTLILDDLSVTRPRSQDGDNESVVSHILSQLHPWTLSKVSIIDCTHALRNHHLDSWIQHLLHHPIQDLRIGLLDLTLPRHALFLIPCHLYCFDHLEHLHLKVCEIRPPPGYKGFSKLVELALDYVRIDFDEELGTILSKCPVLETLSIRINPQKVLASKFLNISAPSLKNFCYTGPFSSIRFGSASLKTVELEYGNIIIMPRDDFGSESKMVEFFSQLSNVEQVYLRHSSMEYLCIGDVVERLAKDLNCLVHLEIDPFRFGTKRIVISALCLIKSSPTLKSLRLWCGLSRVNEDVSVIQYLKTQKMCNFSLSHLKTVEMFDMSGSKTENEFIKLILLWATTLETLTITWDDAMLSSKPRCVLVKEVASYPRASPTAVIESD